MPEKAELGAVALSLTSGGITSKSAIQKWLLQTRDKMNRKSQRDRGMVVWMITMLTYGLVQWRFLTKQADTASKGTAA